MTTIHTRRSAHTAHTARSAHSTGSVGTAPRTSLTVACAAFTAGLLALGVPAPLLGGATGTAAAATAAAPADRYVSPAGDDSDDGTAAHPWRTIAHAADEDLAPGTTVHVADGAYPQAVENDNNGTAGAYVTFAADHLGKARIAYTGTGFPFHDTGDYVRITGFDISAPHAREALFVDANHTVIENNHVHDVAGDSGLCNSHGGDGMGDPADEGHNTFTGNVVEDIGPSGECQYIHGIYPSGAGDVVRNNIVRGSSGSGIRFNHNTTGATIAANLVYANRDHGVSISGDDDSDTTASGFTITDNIIVDNAMFGINVRDNADSDDNEYGHNLIHDNGYGMFGLNNTRDEGTWEPSRADGEIDDDPGLVDYREDGTGDYHLTADSPCVDAGTATGAPDTDIEGTARPQGAGYDIGPFEYTSDDTTPPGDGNGDGDGGPSAPPAPGDVTAGFEDGTTQGWSSLYGHANPTVTSDPVYEGTHALRFSLAGDGHSAVGTTRGLDALTPGATVTYHVYADRPGTTVAPFVRDRNHRAVQASPVALPAGQWTTVTWTVPRVDAVGALGLDASAGSGTVTLDALTWPTS
jgi:hypothetical protein